MSRPIRLGDPTSGGGEVTECQLAERQSLDARPMAVLGDRATCPLHQGSYDFVEAHAGYTINGLALVLEGHRLRCGCHAIATCSSMEVC